MDARDYFHNIVKPNYEEAKHNVANLRPLWNAMLTMNAVAEAIALERLNYSNDVDRHTLNGLSSDVRLANPPLVDLKNCVDALKHVRKLTTKITGTSTNIDPSASSSWQIEIGGTRHNLVSVMDQAFAVISKLPEITRLSS